MRMPRPKTRNVSLLGTLLLISCYSGLQGGEAFANTKNSNRNRVSTKIYSDYDDNGNNEDSSGASYWRLPNDFSMFLTQRSIQSFMFLTSQLRDPETCYWVEDFTKPNLANSNKKAEDFSLANTIPNLSDAVAGKSDWRPSNDDDEENDEDEEERRTCHLLRYHGLGAMDTDLFPNWEKYFEEMLEQPTDSWIIASDHPHIPDYKWEIDPSSVCSRILSVREQLSREFSKDLQAVANMGGQTLDWYWDQLRQSRDREQQREEQQQELNSGEQFEGIGANTPLIDPASLRGSRNNLLFLEINVDSPELDHKPSPLRSGNFDLLVLLATEEAIVRVLNRWESKKSRGDLIGSEFVSHGFLEDFYIQRQRFFQGPLPSYGKADDILEELLFSSLSFRADASTSSSSVIDPTAIAELILREREQVALDWRDIALEAPEHHMRIQKLRLLRMMGSQQEGSDSSSVAETARSHDPGPGAFE